MGTILAGITFLIFGTSLYSVYIRTPHIFYKFTVHVRCTLYCTRVDLLVATAVIAFKKGSSRYRTNYRQKGSLAISYFFAIWLIWPALPFLGIWPIWPSPPPAHCNNFVTTMGGRRTEWVYFLNYVAGFFLHPLSLVESKKLKKHCGHLSVLLYDLVFIFLPVTAAGR